MTKFNVNSQPFLPMRRTLFAFLALGSLAGPFVGQARADPPDDQRHQQKVQPGSQGRAHQQQQQRWQQQQQQRQRWQQAQQYDNRYRYPDRYYGTPPVVYPPPGYYQQQGPAFIFSFPFLN